MGRIWSDDPRRDALRELHLLVVEDDLDDCITRALDRIDALRDNRGDAA